MLVQVKLYDRVIGTVDWNIQRGSATFQYSTDAKSSLLEPSPILMPKEGSIFETNRDHQNFHNLPYLLSDSMPDDFGNVMMKEWLRQKNLKLEDINPVDRLTYVGIRGMGALEYEPINHKSNNEYDIDVTELLEVAQKVLEGKQDISYDGFNEETLTDILRIGTSVGGARAKALIAIKQSENNKIVGIKPGDVNQGEGYTYWLLKMDGANKKTLGEGDGIGKIEYAYYRLAQLAGVEMTESRLYEENDRFHFLTKRFDRSDTGRKIHMQTFGALAGIDFKVQRASSYEALFRVMKRLQIRYPQFEQQFRRAVFNIVSRNHDDHVKNFSFLMDQEGKWKISPAYDITYSYSPGGTWTNAHQSSLNGKYDNFRIEDLVEFGKSFGIKKSTVIVQEVIDAVSQWPKIARDIEIPRNVITSINTNLRTEI